MITKEEVQSIIHRTCSEQGVQNYSIQFSNTKSALGQCFYDSPVLNSDRSYNRHKSSVRFRISSFWMEHADHAEMVDTILHEVAHAIAGPYAKHGPEWKVVARRLGCAPKAHADVKLSQEIKEQTSKWMGVCPNGHKSFRNRLTRDTKLHAACAECSPTYNANFRFDWTQLR